MKTNLCLAGMLLAGIALAGGPLESLNIRPTALVTGPDVLLSDLAANPAELPPGWGDRIVLKAPSPGTPQQVSITTVAYALQQYPDMSSCSLRGGMNITVRREGVPLDFTLIEKAIAAFIEQDDYWVNAQVQIECDPLRDPVLVPPSAQVEIRPRGYSEDPGATDYYVFEVNLVVDGRVDRDIPIRAKVVKLQEFWVAAQPISRGKKLEPADLRTKWLPESNLRKGYLPASEPADGFQIDRPLRIDQPLSRHFLQQPLCASRGDWIFVTGRRGSLKITLRARALSNGRLGDRVLCENELSKRRLLVRLVGSKQASIDL